MRSVPSLWQHELPVLCTKVSAGPLCYEGLGHLTCDKEVVRSTPDRIAIKGYTTWPLA